MRPLDPRLIRYARTTAIYVAGCAAIGAVTGALVIAQAFLLTDAVVSVSLAGLPLLAAVIAGRALLAWLQEVLAHRSSAAVKAALRRQVLRRSVELGPVWLAGERRSALTTLLTSGLDALDDYFARYLPQLVLAVVVPASVVAVLFTTDLVSALTVALTLPLIPVFMALVGLATSAHTRRRWRSLELLAHHFADVVAGLPTLKIFGRAKAQAAAVRAVSDSYRRESLGTLRIAFLSSLVLELLATLSVALVAVGVGVRLVEGELDLRTALLALILAPEAYLPLRLVGTHYHASADGLAAAEEAFRILETPAPQRFPAVARRADTALVVSGLEVRYASQSEPAVRNLSFRVRPGEIVALTGPSGSGKSSTLSAILGFVQPAGGTIESGRAAWVPQRPYLFRDTIAGNVRLGSPQASPAEVRAALVAAGAGDLDPDRPIGERGEGLSAGQARRVALARALVGGPDLLLLDEPTAGLDPDTEHDVAGTLDGLRQQGKAILLVSHRPALLELADATCAVG
ncbi:ABC transporter ATP-binding protein/permease [Flindersiella endophytica]